MPQLNPSPWFLIFMLTWATLMFVMLNKTLNLNYPNITLHKELELPTTTPWAWPWT